MTPRYQPAPMQSLQRAGGRPGGPQEKTPQELERQRAFDLSRNASDYGLAGHVTDPNTGATYSTSGAGASSSGGGDDYDIDRLAAMFPGATTVAPPTPQVPQVGPIDTSAAQAAAFARAKDQVGQTAGGAIRSLRSVAGSRGMLGSGSEGRQTASVINAGQGQLGDVSRGQAIDTAKTAADTAKFNYTGAVEQRGQDMNAAARARELALAENNARFSQMAALTSLRRVRKGGPAVSY